MIREKKKYSRKKKRLIFAFPILSIILIGVITIFSSMYEKSWVYNWSGIRPEIKDSIQMAEYGGISSGIVGISGIKPKQYDRRHWIMENTTTAELLRLTEYPDGTIKTIAYEGLIRKADYKNKTDLVFKALQDKEYQIEYYAGCEGMRMNVGEYLIEFVLYIDSNSPPPIDGRNPYKISEKEVDVILTEYRRTASSWK
ncbi:hypothetical protein [Fulvivirga sp.]|uniref:hypothetical protein n=1 Tax=Fulvivirga sp. TaxID=1931237 RepID=UPI0032EDC419